MDDESRQCSHHRDLPSAVGFPMLTFEDKEFERVVEA